MTVCCRNRKAYPKIHLASQRSQIAKAMFKKNKSEGLTLPNFKTYYKATKTLLAKGRTYVDPWNRTNILEINSHITIK